MCTEGAIVAEGCGSTCGGAGGVSGVCRCGPEGEVGCVVGVGSRRGGCGVLAAWDTSVCATCCAACDEGCCWGSGSTETTGLGGVGTTAAAVGAGDAGGGWDGIADGLRVSGSRDESEGGRGGEGGFGAAIGAAKSTFVVSATAMATGGGAIGPVRAMVI